MSNWDFSKEKVVKFLIACVCIISITYFLNLENYAVVQAKDGLNIRSGPGIQYEIIKSLSYGEKTKILKTNNDWHKIVFDDSLIGWVSSKYCNIVKERSIPWFGGGGPLTDDNGFTVASYQFRSPKEHGQPLYKFPNSNSHVIRQINQFESYSVSNRKQNGFTHVKLHRDDAIGWVKKTKTFSPIIFAKSSKVFLKTLLSFSSIIAIAFGLALSWFIIKILFSRNYRFWFLVAYRIDQISVIIAGIGTLGATIIIGEVSPFDKDVVKLRATFAFGAVYMLNIVPAYVSVMLGELLFLPYKHQKEKILGPAIGGLFGLYILFTTWGWAAGWWS